MSLLTKSDTPLMHTHPLELHSQPQPKKHSSKPIPDALSIPDASSLSKQSSRLKRSRGSEKSPPSPLPPVIAPTLNTASDGENSEIESTSPPLTLNEEELPLPRSSRKRTRLAQPDSSKGPLHPNTFTDTLTTPIITSYRNPSQPKQIPHIPNSPLQPPFEPVVSDETQLISNTPQDRVLKRISSDAHIAHASQVKTPTEPTQKKLYLSKLSELEFDSKRLDEGSLQEYRDKLATLEEQMKLNMKRIKNTYTFSERAHKNLYDESSKRAYESFNAKLRNIKSKMMQHKTCQKWKLKQEFDLTQKHPNAKNEFLFSAITIKRKREAEAEYAELTYEGIPRNAGNIPEWTKTLLKRHTLTGDKTILVPPYCSELKEYEKDEDIAFIRMCRS